MIETMDDSRFPHSDRDNVYLKDSHNDTGSVYLKNA